MELREVVVHSLESLRRNLLRSALTMLGIIWGLTTVVLLLGYGQSLGNSVLSAFLGIGNNVIMFWGGQTSMQAGGERAGKRVRFKYEDIAAIREEVDLIKGVSGEVDEGPGFKYGDKVVSISSKCIQMPYGEMRRLRVVDGRFFEEGDFLEHRRVVIFGPHAAKKVFGNRNPVGEYVGVNGQQFLVIGMLENKIQDSSNNGPDSENAFFPYETAADVLGFRDPDMIVFQPLRPELHIKAKNAVRAVLAARHQFNPKDEKATPDWDTVEDVAEITQFSIALQVILGLIGALTLGVGGVGVMNIMLVSVTERTREIGLRKALGARKRDIAIQFLMEALVLTFLAGVLGMLFATLLAHAIPPMPLYSEMYKTANNEGDIILETSTPVMASSFLILSAVGVFAGLWPALKAAGMDPVEALRYE